MQIFDIKTDAKGKELTNHGFEDFPCSFYDEKFSHFLTGEVPWHWHDEVEIVYIVDGSTKVECLQESAVLTAGDVIFINSGRLHKLTDVGQVDCKILNFIFAPVFVGGSLHSKIFKHYILPVINNSDLSLYKFIASVDWQNQIIEELKQAFTACQNRVAAYEMLVQIHLTKIWQIFCSHEPSIIKKVNNSGASVRRIHAALSFIHQHYAHNITVANIGDSANVSESECYRLFKTNLNSTPNNYLLSYRLQRAAYELYQSNKSITEIAHQSGFSNPSYFSKRFVSAYGKTPKAFRKEGKSNNP